MIGLPATPPDVQHVYHQFVIRTPQRDRLNEYLTNLGIGTGIHYPVPIHRQPAYSRLLATAGPLRESDVAAGQIISLPMYPELTHDEVVTVAQHIIEWPELHG